MTKLRITLIAVREIELKPEWLDRTDHSSGEETTISEEQFIEETKESILDDPFSHLDNGDVKAEVTVEKLP